MIAQAAPQAGGEYKIRPYEDPALENTKALFDITAEPEIHASFVVFDGVAAGGLRGFRSLLTWP